MGHFIYGLSDPSDPAQRIRYVGYSRRPARRLIEHLCEARANATHRHRWLNSLIARGVRPEIVILEAVRAETWRDRERHWIAALSGNRLVNATAGGEGLIDPSPEVRAKISAKVSASLQGNQHRLGVPHSDETRAAIGAGIRASESHKMAMRRPRKPLSANHRAAVAAAKRGKPHPRTPEWNAKLTAAKIGRRWINNGLSQRQLPAGENVPDGWRCGRLPALPLVA